MLVLTRKRGQSVMLTLPDGREIRVMFLERTSPQQVRLGFEAPQDITIVRTELLDKEQEE